MGIEEEYVGEPELGRILLGKASWIKFSCTYKSMS